MVLAESEMPFTVELALFPVKSQILLAKMLLIVAPLTVIPLTADAPVEDRVDTALLFTLIVAEVLLQVIPVTAPPAPVELRLLMVLLAIFRVFAPLKVDPT